MYDVVKLRWITFALALSCIAAPAAADEGRPPVHVQIVLDSSGSMKTSDPHRLSLLAGMIFTDLAGPRDALGVLSMRNGRFVTESITRVGDDRTEIRRAIRTLPFGGATFCAEPLDEAREGLARLRKEQPDAEQFVIFLSDGACRPERNPGAGDVRPSAVKLREDDVKIFGIRLPEESGEGGDDPAADLRAMTSVTGGELFEANEAADLPRTFASILGRIVGSEEIQVPLRAGEEVTVDLDGYVYDASIIATGSRAPVIFDAVEGPSGAALELAHRSGTTATSDRHYVAAFHNGHGQHYSVIRIDEPESGKWTFRVDGPSDLQGLLIQNYALDPVVELEGSRPVYELGSTATLSGWLRGRDGERLEDDRFLQRVEFRAFVGDPGGREREVQLHLKDGGRFEAELSLDQAGEWIARARVTMKNGGLNKMSAPASYHVRASTLALAQGQGPLDLGEVKAGTSSGVHDVDLGGSELVEPVELAMRLEGDEHVSTLTTAVTVAPGEAVVPVTFEVDAEHPGGSFEANLVLAGDGQEVRVPVRGVVLPITFWERWGSILTAIGVGLVLLLLLLVIVRGFVTPHRFPRDAVLNWGDSLERLQRNKQVIRERAGTRSGFYRNAKLEIGGRGGFPKGGAHRATLEATGPSQITITAEPGTKLLKVNKFDHSEVSPVDGDSAIMRSGEIYKLDELYLRLR